MKTYHYSKNVFSSKSVMSCMIALFIVIFSATLSLTSQADEQIKDKSLVVWASPDNLEQKGGSVLTIDNLDAGFDAVVFGELQNQTWMPGSEGFSRSQSDQASWKRETAKPGEFVQVALVYEGDTITLYRNGEVVAVTEKGSQRTFPKSSAVLVGLRHIHPGLKDSFIGSIEDARIYDTALTQDEIKALTPNKLSSIEPIAWWDFENGSVADKTGNYTDILTIGKAKVRDGKLHLSEKGDTLIAFPTGVVSNQLEKVAAFFRSNSSSQLRPGDAEAQRNLRRVLLEDKLRPVWHFTIPEGTGYPFDPNGAIFKDGVYHLWYLYQAEAGHHWCHVSSIDLFHWRWHSYDLQQRPGDPDTGIFSGNAFLANDGNVVIAYHGLGTGGNCVAYSSDPELNFWKKPDTNPIANPGWDPHMWVEGDTYYQISGGNPPILYKGDSYDKPMEKVGDFLSHDMPDVDDFEDISCPDFFKLGDKWVLVCISHPRGARYYIGDWNGSQFTPETHLRMNWPGGTCFAPETLLDDQNRRIFWAWVLDRKTGNTSGTMTMPRVLTLAEDKRSLNITPPQEVESLRYQPQSEAGFNLKAGESVRLENIAGNIMELNLTIDPGQAKKFGVKVLCSKDGREQTPILIDRENDIMRIDMRSSSLEPVKYHEFTMRDPNPVVETEDAPFELKDGEKVNLRIFLDKTILEVFADERQCMTQVLYPTLDDAVHVEIFTEDAPIKVEEIKSWKLFPAMQW
ncbi:MAG: GH32 C-terminal domain-containing protein [Thermoguttaceae bacterium]